MSESDSRKLLEEDWLRLVGMCDKAGVDPPLILPSRFGYRVTLCATNFLGAELKDAIEDATRFIAGWLSMQERIAKILWSHFGRDKEVQFTECCYCASHTGMPALCESCLKNRALINNLRNVLQELDYEE